MRAKSDLSHKYSDLFSKLDVNKDGVIDIQELRAATLNAGLNVNAANKLFEKGDANFDQRLDLAEFVKYMVSHERELKLAFNSLDHNKDGIIDENEIVKSFRDLGISISPVEAKTLLQRLDSNKTLKIEWEEWRDFLMFQSASSLHDILHLWRHSTIIDIGENALIPDDFTEKEMKSGLWWRQLVAGGVAGMASRSVTAPLDRLKVFCQVHGANQNKSLWKGLLGMIEEGGVKSLWRGNGMNVVKIAPESALKFMAYEQIKSLVKGESKRDLNIGERLLSGSLAGASAQTAIYPMEVLKTRLAIRKSGQYKGIMDCALKLYKNEGLSCFYRGYIPNILGIIPYAGIDLAIYETLKITYSKRYENADPGVFVLLGCGTASSTCGQLASYPLALVRTRLQAQAALGSQIKDTMTSMFTHILQKEGVRGLYCGIAPNFLKVAPAVSIGYVIYEQCRSFLGINPK